MSGHPRILEAEPADDWMSALKKDEDEWVVDLLKDQRPVAAIAKLIGKDRDYTYSIVNRLLQARPEINYRPEADRAAPMLGEGTRAFRAVLAGKLYALRDQVKDRLGLEGTDVVRAGKYATGLTRAQQKRAIERPYTHDWKLSELQRLAEATGQDVRELLAECAIRPEHVVRSEPAPVDTGFRSFVLKSLLSPDEYRKVMACLSR
jgi:hypothetical protein